ncbi:polyprenyl synthetase family protein [Lysinibacillus sphaericus]|uniref:polyprenyl synthetase family protein n=1 Tax=Lysinibacillus sphaericus TaxID=1421 RepID=UPI003D704161
MNLNEYAQKILDTENIPVKLKEQLRTYISYHFIKGHPLADLLELAYDNFRENPETEHKQSLQLCIELLLLAADIIDDIQDKDAKKQPWANISTEDNLTCIITLIMLSLKILPLNQEIINTHIHKLLLRAISGQYSDTNNQVLTESDYVQMVTDKSSSFFEMALLLGAGDIYKSIQNNLKACATHYGIIAQVRNDWNDLYNEDKALNDLYYRRKSLPIIYALQQDNALFKPLQNFYLHGENQPLNRLLKSLHNEEVTNYCKFFEQLHLFQLRKCLLKLPLENNLIDKFSNFSV